VKSSTKTIRVLLVDDHTLVRAGIRALLADLAGVTVTGEAQNGREALRLAKDEPPDIVLLDISMPEMNGLETIGRLAKETPRARVVILSMHANEEYVLQALRYGAAGYLLKDASSAELELAIRAAARGETYLSPAVSKTVIEDYLHRTGAQPELADITEGPYRRLTPRQREVLQLIAEGHTTREIAARLHLRVKTVETHRTQLMRRLDIHDVAGLVRYAIRMGLIASDD